MPKKVWVVILFAILLISGGGIGIYFYRQAHDPEIFLQQSEKLFQSEKYHEALKYCLAAETLMRRAQKEQSEEYASLLLKKGKICYFLNQFNESRNCSLLAKRIFFALGQKQGIIIANINIGNIAYKHEDYSSAILYLKEALDANLQDNYLSETNLCSSQLYLALSYYNLKMNIKAKAEFLKCLSSVSAIHGVNSYELSKIHYYLGDIGLEVGDFAFAQNHFQDALDILKKSNPEITKGLDKIYWGLAKSFKERNKFKEAIYNAQQAVIFTNSETPIFYEIKQAIQKWEKALVEPSHYPISDKKNR